MKKTQKILHFLITRSNTAKFCTSTTKHSQTLDINRIRNIGILAHIDAGKTTTTERMLFYSGFIKQMGEVHHGNTVTDYMDQERERGITITSAAVTFYWKKHQFNLIDTPGHIDFTMEVEQTLNVLDGAVVILDGSAGVEAQTQTVWRQADRYKIPRLVFVNKMDRRDANIKMSCESIKKKLECPYLLLQLPVKNEQKLVGIIDLLSLELLTYGTEREKIVKRVPLSETEWPKLWEQAKTARGDLIDKLTELNDDLANLVISLESLDDIKPTDVVKAIQQVSLSKQNVVPVLLGSAYKNIGIQALMDAIVLYLPSPDQVNQQFSAFDDNLCARAFKVIHDKQRGPLVFLRLYNGCLSKGQKIHSVQQEASEQTGRLYMAYADDFKEVPSIGSGNIAVVSGLKKVMSGDLVTSSQAAVQKAKNKLTKTLKKDEVEDIDTLFGIGAKVPDPVFFCSIEPPNVSSQQALDQALVELQREDPSLRVTQDEETGQTVLGGMGELHLEIIRDRILKEYKINADLGPLQIAYREAPKQKLRDNLRNETKIGSSKQLVGVTLSVMPTEEKDIKHIMRLDKSPDAASGIASIFPKHLLAVKQGIMSGLAHGPKINSQVVNTEIMLHSLEVGRGTSDSFITASVTQLVQKLLKDADTSILEPIMSLEITVPDEHLSSVLMDLSRRRANISNIDVRGCNKIIYSNTPLAELLGYATILRTITSGTGSFVMEFQVYKGMSALDEDKVIKKVRGF